MTLDIDIYGEIKMKEEHRNKIIVDIGGNSDERYGYNYKNNRHGHSNFLQSYHQFFSLLR